MTEYLKYLARKGLVDRGSQVGSHQRPTWNYMKLLRRSILAANQYSNLAMSSHSGRRWALVRLEGVLSSE